VAIGTGDQTIYLRKSGPK